MISTDYFAARATVTSCSTTYCTLHKVRILKIPVLYTQSELMYCQDVESICILVAIDVTPFCRSFDTCWCSILVYHLSVQDVVFKPANRYPIAQTLAEDEKERRQRTAANDSHSSAGRASVLEKMESTTRRQADVGECENEG